MQADIASLLELCVYCGKCNAACPLVELFPSESVSPRGKIAITQAIINRELSISPQAGKIASYCLYCLRCLKACPNGVEIDKVILYLRQMVALNKGSALNVKAIQQWIDKQGLAHNKHFTVLIRAMNRLSHTGLLHRLPYANQRTIQFLSCISPRPLDDLLPPPRQLKGKPKASLALFSGCMIRYMFPNIGLDTVSVFERLGYQVTFPVEQQCCAMPLFSGGYVKQALDYMLSNLRILGNINVDYFVVPCASCAYQLKVNYPMLISSHNPDLVDQANEIATKVKDFSELLVELGEPDDIELRLRQPVRATYHDPCHLAYGRGIATEPRQILRSIGNLELIEMPNQRCCGMGGAFMSRFPDVSSQLLSLKARDIHSTKSSLVVTSCPACRYWISTAYDRENSLEVLTMPEVLKRALP